MRPAAVPKTGAARRQQQADDDRYRSIQAALRRPDFGRIADTVLADRLQPEREETSEAAMAVMEWLPALPCVVVVVLVLALGMIPR